jgi:hypothetical protein
MLETAAQRNPPRAPPLGTESHVTPQCPAHNLIQRVHERRDYVLRFITELRVPFDNN